jgi:hypothetical protein
LKYGVKSKSIVHNITYAYLINNKIANTLQLPKVNSWFARFRLAGEPVKKGILSIKKTGQRVNGPTGQRAQPVSREHFEADRNTVIE